MATPLRHLIDEVITDLKQTIDDAEIDEVTVGFWIITESNKLLGQHIGKRDSGAFLTTWTGVPVIEPTTTLQNAVVAGRKYIVLPATIFDFDGDGAIDYIAYTSDGGAGCPPEFEFVNFERTTPKESRMLRFHPKTTPRPACPYFYRTGDFVPLLGIENINVPAVEVGIYSTIKPITEINIDDPFTFPEELMAVLRRNLLDLGRFILIMPNDNRQNVGADETTPSTQIPGQKIVSVNQNATE